MFPTWPETNPLVVAIFRFLVSHVNAVKRHVYDTNIPTCQDFSLTGSRERRIRAYPSDAIWGGRHAHIICYCTIPSEVTLPPLTPAALGLISLEAGAGAARGPLSTGISSLHVTAGLPGPGLLLARYGQMG